MKKFVIVLKNEKTKTYATISWLITLANFIAFLYTGVSIWSKNSIFPFSGAALLFFIVLFQLLIKRKQESKIDNFKLTFSIIIITWLLMSLYWIAAINLLLYIFQDISRRKLEVIFCADTITYPSFPKRIIRWDDLNNIVLKDGLLTIDLSSNKLIQQLIDEKQSTVNEKEFNEFCSGQLKK